MNRISILVIAGSLLLTTNQQSIIAASSTTDIKYAITPQYTSASPFVEGLAYIGDGKFIDKNNEVKVVVPYPEFAEVSDFYDGYSYIGIPGSKDYRNWIGYT